MRAGRRRSRQSLLIGRMQFLFGRWILLIR
jgi:hypothetical protein